MLKEYLKDVMNVLDEEDLGRHILKWKLLYSLGPDSIVRMKLLTGDYSTRQLLSFFFVARSGGKYDDTGALGKIACELALPRIILNSMIRAAKEETTMEEALKRTSEEQLQKTLGNKNLKLTRKKA